VRLGDACRGDDLLIGRGRASVADVVPHGASEQDRLLRGDADGAAQRRQIHVAHVVAAHLHAARRHVVKAGHQVDQAGLAGAGGSEDRHGLAGPHLKGDVVQHRVGAVLVVGKDHVLKGHAAVQRHVLERAGAVGDVRDGVQDFEDTVAGGRGARELHDQHADHHHLKERLLQVGDEGQNLADFHAGADHRAAAEPEHGHGAHVGDDDHRRHGHRHDAHRADGRVGEVGVRPAEAGDLVHLAHKGLHHAHAREVFLQDLVQRVQFGLHRPEHRRAALDQVEHQAGHQRQEREGHPGQARGGDDGHYQPAHHQERPADHDAEERPDGVLDVRHVVREAGDQLPGLDAVQVAEGEALHVPEQVAAQVGAEALGGAGGKDAVAGAAEPADDGRADHQQADADDDGHVQRGDALVDNAAEERGLEEVAGDLAHHQQGGDNRPGAVRLEIARQFTKRVPSRQRILLTGCDEREQRGRARARSAVRGVFRRGLAAGDRFGRFRGGLAADGAGQVAAHGQQVAVERGPFAGIEAGEGHGLDVAPEVMEGSVDVPPGRREVHAGEALVGGVRPPRDKAGPLHALDHAADGGRGDHERLGELRVRLAVLVQEGEEEHGLAAVQAERGERRMGEVAVEFARLEEQLIERVRLFEVMGIRAHASSRRRCLAG